MNRIATGCTGRSGWVCSESRSTGKRLSSPSPSSADDGVFLRRARRRLREILGCFLLVLLLLAGCSPSTAPLTGGPDGSGSGTNAAAGNPSCLAGVPRTEFASEGVFVEPTDGVAPIVQELNDARCTIDVGIYLLTNEDILTALERAAGRGVAVRVIIERYPYGGSTDTDALAKRLDAAGIAHRWSDSRFRFTHAKYIVIDSSVALVLNMNLTASAFKGNREFGALSTDPEAVMQLQRVFDRDWDGETGRDPPGPLILSPTTSRSEFLDLIDHSTTSIDLYAEVINDAGIINALGYAAQAGVRVRLIVNPPANDGDRATYAAMKRSGIEVAILGRRYVHAKALMIDGKLAVIGSQNFTPTSLDSNREVALIVTSQGSVERVAAVFAQDWSEAKPFSG